MTGPLAESTAGNPTLNVALFLGIVAVTLIVVFRAGRRGSSSPADYLAAGGSLSGLQNGMALSGDYLSAAAFLGVAGAVAVEGFDGFTLSIGFLVAWVVPLLLVAERVRNTGRFTLGDVVAFRMRQRPVRAAAATSTLAIAFFAMLAQLAGAGALVTLLLDVHSGGGRALVIAIVGAIMISYVLLGGMRGTTWVQIIKAGLLLTTVVLMAVFLLGKFGFNVSSLLDRAVQGSQFSERVLGPGTRYGRNAASKLEFISLSLALVLGTAALPHVLMRFYTVPDARQARRSVITSAWMMVLFYLSTMIIGYGASAIVGSRPILDAPGAENSAVPLLAFAIGGTVLLAIVAAVAFTTILAVVTGLTLSASAAFAHDVYANLVKRGRPAPGSEVRVARLTAVVIGGLAILGGILAVNQNTALLLGLAFALAASANLPAILYTLLWRRFNTTGTLWAIYGGLGSCLLLILFSPVVSGYRDSIVPGVNFHWFPLSNPGIVSIPLGFLFGYLGARMGRDHPDPARSDELEVRSITGIGAPSPG